MTPTQHPRPVLAAMAAATVWSTLAAGLLAQQPGAEPPSVVDFERHIAPRLSRFGCNSAACHGAFGGGKGGLQLSLFGYSSKMDFQNLEDRIDRSDPAESLVLQKPTGQLEHEGGVRFASDSATFRTIRRWIEQGARWRAGSGRVHSLIVQPRQIVFDRLNKANAAQPSKLVVTAHFSDGSSEQVTHLCQFTSRDEGIALVDAAGRVTAASHGDTSIIVAYGNAFVSVNVLSPFRGDAQGPSPNVPASNRIDSRINAKLRRLNLPVSSRASDAEFLRRVTLDTIGTIPTPEDVTEFCADSDPDKRAREIDRLLSHPMHAALWATRMCDITKCDVRSMGEERRMAANRAQMWHDWFRRRFAEDVSYAEIVRGVLTATSRGHLSVADWMKQEEALIHQARESFENNYADRQTLDLFWRRLPVDGENILKANAELTAAAFTGVRINCAQCHKHPFDRWTQDDYAGFANIFSRVVFGSSPSVNAEILSELDRRQAAKQRGEPVKSLPRIREVFISSDLARPISGSEPAADIRPRAFAGPPFSEQQDPRHQLFEWLVAPDNPYFAQSFANRVWAVYFGTGIVEPVDDFSVTNPPSHPELLADLARQFRESGFNIHGLERRILMSAAYQRSSTPLAANRDDRRNFSRQTIRPLLAEVALDSLNRALDTEPDFGDVAAPGKLAIEVGTNQVGGQAGRALQVFGRGTRESVCDCDRRTQSDLRQFLFLINDPAIAAKIRRGTIRKLLAAKDEDLIRRLYLRILGRQPTPREQAVGLRHLRAGEDRETAFDDLVWALVNTREFITNH